MTHPFIQARDFLQRHREDYATARREFRWPALTEFNWALDFFDVQARSNPTPALWIVEDDGSACRLSYAQMSERSNRVANFLKDAGVRRGDRLLLMVPNQTAIWEAMLASIKLGAVIVPSTTQLTADDLRDRIERGAIRHALVASSETHKFETMPAGLTRVSVGEPRPGWLPLEEAKAASPHFTPTGPTQARDPLPGAAQRRGRTRRGQHLPTFSPKNRHRDEGGAGSPDSFRTQPGEGASKSLKPGGRATTPASATWHGSWVWTEPPSAKYCTRLG